MKKILCSALTSLALAVSVPAFAQTAAPVSARAIDPAAAQAVRDLLAGLLIREKLDYEMALSSQPLPDGGISADVKLVRQIATQSVNGDAKLNESQKRDALEKFEKTMPRVMRAVQGVFSDFKLVDRMIDGMIGEIVPLYARNFTAAEIGQLSAFYATPLGVKVSTDVPIATQAEIDQLRAFTDSALGEKNA